MRNRRKRNAGWGPLPRVVQDPDLCMILMTVSHHERCATVRHMWAMYMRRTKPERPGMTLSHTRTKAHVKDVHWKLA